MAHAPCLALPRAVGGEKKVVGPRRRLCASKSAPGGSQKRERPMQHREEQKAPAEAGSARGRAGPGVHAPSARPSNCRKGGEAPAQLAAAAAAFPLSCKLCAAATRRCSRGSGSGDRRGPRARARAVAVAVALLLLRSPLSVRPSARPPSPSLCVFGAEERWQRLHFLLHFHPWGGGRRRRGGASTSPPPVAKRLRASAAPPAPPAAGGRGGSLGRGAARASGPGAANFPGGSAPPLGRKAPPPPRALCSSAAEALPPPLPRFLPPRALRIRQCKGSQRRRAGPHPPTSS